MNSYDPFDPQTIADPYARYAWLRDAAPCHHVASRDIWVISRYDDVLAALRDTRVFSSSEGVGYERRPVPMMIAYDPPAHTRLRRIVSSPFTPRQIARLRPRIEKIVSDLLEPLLGAGTVDWIEQLALPLPVRVIAELMGIPPERRADFKRWSSATVQALGGAVDLTPAERVKVEGAIGEFASYFHGVIAERRATRGVSAGDDLISLLLQANRDEEKLLDGELISFCILLLVAGNETTTSLIGNCALACMTSPDEWAQVEADPGLVPALIEEALRYDSPIQGFFRNTLREVEVAGQAIPQGAKVMVLYGAANRDPRKFPDPERFQVRRHPEDHLAFGAGPHICLGAHLARLEAEVLARTFLRRVRTMHREGEAVRTRNPLLRGVARMPVRLTAR